MDTEQRIATLAAGLALVGAAVFLNGGALARNEGEIQRATHEFRSATKLLGAPELMRISRALPLAFEENRGQNDPRVKFLARGSGYSVLLTPAEVVLVLRQDTRRPSKDAPRRVSATRQADNMMGDQIDAGRTPHARRFVKMTFAGANPASAIVGVEPLPGRVNYFIGADPSHWQSDVPTYGKVKVREVYPGVDVVYYGKRGHLEFDVVVAPGAHPGVVQLVFEGAQGVKRDAHGDLCLSTPDGELHLRKPRVYQEVPGGRAERVAEFALQPPEGADPNDAHITMGFRVAAYDPAVPLIIDPVISYSSYLGGSADDRGLSIAVDASGNAYLTGVANSVDFPTALPLQAGNGGSGDVFVTKISASGTGILYSTFLGGSMGDQGNGIAVDALGNAYVTGHTSSLDFPTVNPLQTAIGNGDTFVAKLNPSGSALVYSTYLAGGGNEFGIGIAVGSAGSAYVTGITNSRDFPTVNAVQPTLGGGFDAFVTQLNPSGSAIVYSTYLGGSSDESNAFADGVPLEGGIAVDTAGNAYVTGGTESPDFPVVNALQPTRNEADDAFVTKIAPAGLGIVYSTYLGGSLSEFGRGIAVDAAGNAYVTGQTSGPDFPTVNPRQAAYGGGVGDAFVAKLDPDGFALLYSTFLGGAGFDRGMAIAVDSRGNAYVVGQTDSINFPTAAPIQATFAGGLSDAFVAQLTATGSEFGYSTYLGGNDFDLGLGGAVDGAGNTYVTGYTLSPDFPASVRQLESGGGADAFVAKIGLSGGSSAVIPLGGDSKGGCAVATAAYGSALDPHVQALRDFRDRYLMKTSMGRTFVSLYYAYSPPIAAVIARHDGLKLAARATLTPVVYAIVYPLGTGLCALIAVAAAGCGVRIRHRLHKRRP